MFGWWGTTFRTMGKVSTDKSVQNFSHYLSLLSRRILVPKFPQYNKIAASTAEPFVLMISTDHSHSAGVLVDLASLM